MELKSFAGRRAKRLATAAKKNKEEKTGNVHLDLSVHHAKRHTERVEKSRSAVVLGFVHGALSDLHHERAGRHAEIALNRAAKSAEKIHDRYSRILENFEQRELRRRRFKAALELSLEKAKMTAIEAPRTLKTITAATLNATSLIPIKTKRKVRAKKRKAKKKKARRARKRKKTRRIKKKSKARRAKRKSRRAKKAKARPRKPKRKKAKRNKRKQSKKSRKKSRRVKKRRR